MADLARIIEAIRLARAGDATAGGDAATLDAATRLHESAMAGGHDGDPFGMDAMLLATLAEYFALGEDLRRTTTCLLAAYLTDPDVLTEQARTLGERLVRNHVAAVGAEAWSQEVARLLLTARRVGSAALVGEVITKARLGRDAATPGSVPRSALLSDLSAALQTRFLRAGHVTDLDEAIDAARLAVAETPHEQLMWSLCHNNLGATLRVRYEVTSSVADLDESIEVLRVVADDPDTVSSPSHVHAVCNLGVALRQRYESGSDPGDLEESIRRCRDAVALATGYSPKLREYRSNLAGALLARPAITLRGSAEHPDPSEAIDLLRDALTAPTDDIVQEQLDRHRLAIALRHRFVLHHRSEDADESETILRGLLADTAGSRHHHALVLSTLSRLLLEQLRQAGTTGSPPRSLPRSSSAVPATDEVTAESLEAEALCVAREAVASIKPGHVARTTALITLREVLRHRWKRRHDRGDLDAIVSLDRDLVANDAASGWLRAVNLNHLGSDLSARHQLRHDSADLDDALAAYQAAAAAAPPEHAQHARALALHALALGEAAKRAPGTDRLDAAITKLDEALGVTPRNDPEWADQTLMQSVNRRIRFERAGDPADLNAAIRLARNALAADAGPRLTAKILSHLGAAHRTRYQHLGDSLDLNLAITVGRAAVMVTGAKPSADTGAVAHLSLAYLEQADRSQDPLHLYLAIELARVAVATQPADTPGPVRALDLSNLAIMLLRRAQQEHSTAQNRERDREEAVTALRDALALEPAQSPDRGRYLHNLGNVLLTTPETLNEAISVLRQAVDVTPADHPELGGRRWSLGLALLRRNRPDERHVAEALALWRSAVESGTTPAGVRALAAQSWGEVADGQESLHAYTKTVELLPILANHGLRRADKETTLAEWQGLAGAAAASALAVDRSDSAVELLESGRAVIWQQATGTGTELATLANTRPRLAARLGELRTMLDRQEPVR
ncbi:hypothetical protein [Actinomadura bangladeshensis]|uniref:Uncharacterized protein n=1 Tax=Actinomadura bangladeshensis TaxID=453573 RepID=A0A6L9QH21_9ACTN|nr:hypothetical protein [Actinomadura bangladeshensis]NEA24565.1 hypothetical protein [Actinomadura bangladeshensis]